MCIGVQVFAFFIIYLLLLCALYLATDAAAADAGTTSNKGSFANLSTKGYATRGLQ